MNRKEQLKKLAKESEENLIIKNASLDADLNAADTEDYVDLFFINVLNSIKIEGLED